MERFSIKAVVVGILVDFWLSLLFGVLVGIAVFKGNAAETDFKSVQLLSMSFVAGLPPVLLGGYVTARMAQSYIFSNAAVVGIFGTVFTLLFSGAFPKWYLLVNCLLIIPCALVGALLANRRDGSDDSGMAPKEVPPSS
jgi:hypothetical protein